MKTKTILLLATAAAASFAHAGEGAATGGLSALEIIFIGFGALILIGQFFPAIVLFGSMIRGLFSSTADQGTGSRTLSEKM